MGFGSEKTKNETIVSLSYYLEQVTGIEPA